MTATDWALADCRLMVATPIYEGAQGTYVRAALGLAQRAQALGMSVQFEFILYQPEIARARNMLTGKFLGSDCTHLLFIDADIDFSADDIFAMVKAMQARPECGILGGACPRREFNWRNVARAVELGMAKDNPSDLALYAGEFALQFAHANQNFALTDLVELARIGTGLMLIRRNVIEGVRNKFPQLAFRTDVAERDGYGVGEMVHALFCPMIDPDTQLMLSEDYAFCRRVRDAGFRIWLAPWVKTTHSGPAIFQGSLTDLAQLSAANIASSAE